MIITQLLLARNLCQYVGTTFDFLKAPSTFIYIRFGGCTVGHPRTCGVKYGDTRYICS